MLRFLKLHYRDKLLVVRIFYLSLYYRIKMLVIPFNKLKKNLGAVKEVSNNELEGWKFNYARRLAYYIPRVCKHTPWESKCLVQAMIAQRLLYLKVIESTLYLGIGKDKNKKMIAHAWLKCGERYITGDIGDEFGVVATFRK